MRVRQNNCVDRSCNRKSFQIHYSCNQLSFHAFTTLPKGAQWFVQKKKKRKIRGNGEGRNIFLIIFNFQTSAWNTWEMLVKIAKIARREKIKYKSNTKKNNNSNKEWKPYIQLYFYDTFPTNNNIQPGMNNCELRCFFFWGTLKEVCSRKKRKQSREGNFIYRIVSKI